MLAHYQFTASGGWTGTPRAEGIWAFGMKFSVTADDPDDQVQDWADAVFPDLATQWALASGAGGVISSECQLQQVKFASILTTGLYSGEPGVATGSQNGGVTSTALPPQCAMVVSTVAGSIFRGPGRYGRFYLPGVPSLHFASGVIDSTGQAQYLSWAQSLIEMIIDDYPGANAPVLAHFPPADIAPAVSQVRVGRVVDTQRRRRNKVTEDYLSGGL